MVFVRMVGAPAVSLLASRIASALKYALPLPSGKLAMEWPPMSSGAGIKEKRSNLGVSTVQLLDWKRVELHKIIITMVGIAALGSGLIVTDASAAPRRSHHRFHPWNNFSPMVSRPWLGISTYEETLTGQHCKIYDPILNRCLNSDLESTWPEGLSDYHGSNGE